MQLFCQVIQSHVRLVLAFKRGASVYLVVVFCYAARRSLSGDIGNSCNAKDGNPFGPFWDTFDIDFDSSVFYGPLSYETWFPVVASQWNKRWVCWVKKYFIFICICEKMLSDTLLIL